MSSFNIIVTALGGLILLLALVSKRLANSPFPPSLAALLVGILLGPTVLHVIDPSALGLQPIHRELFARLTLAVGLMGVALRIPRSYSRHNWRSQLVMLGIGMPVTWVISSLLVLLFLGLPLWTAVLIGAILTPTDPVAASSIAVGMTAEENLPGRLRHLISFESGANDGLAYLFVFLPYLLLTHTTGVAVGRWLVDTVLWEVGAATIVGTAIGFVAGKLLKMTERRRLVADNWRLIYTVALALLTVGVGRLLHSDEVLMVFTAGVAFTYSLDVSEQEKAALGQEAVNRFFSVPIFALLGILIPWAGWYALGWRGVALAGAVLLLRRPPVIFFLRSLVPNLHNRLESLFVGWFGPIAVAAIYYASLMEHRLENPVIWHVVSLVICASVVVHGLTGAPVTKWFGHVTGQPHESSPGSTKERAL